MCNVIQCEYCLEDYQDFLVYLRPDGSTMCLDCIRASVPMRNVEAVA